MRRIGSRLLTLLAAVLLLLTLLTVTACADTIPGTAQLTITPTETKVSGDTATVTYSITVTPPSGKELGVFSIRLQPSDGMTLAQSFNSNGEKTITYGDGKLKYDEGSETGIFATYAYTPQTGYFAAVGTTPDRRMSEAARVLTIQATMPANQDGVYTLGAEFIAALDGSGDVYTAQVATTPVTITGGKEPVLNNQPVITETNGDTTGAGSAQTSGSVGNAADTPTVGSDAAAPSGQGDAVSDHMGSDAAVDGTDSGTNATGQAQASGSSVLLWVALAVLIAAAAVVVFIIRRKKK